MSTYKRIREHIKKKHGINIETCHIADAKRKLGLPVRIAHNRKDNSSLVKPCPDSHLPLIKDALKYFGLIK